MSAWEPIDSAPRDGSWFATANFASDTPEFEVGCYLPQKWSSYEPAGDGLFRRVDTIVFEWTHSNFHRATHWMPLPPAPEAA